MYSPSESFSQLIITGRPAAGKTTFADQLLEHGWRKEPGDTTRLLRSGEKAGVDFNFITRDIFFENWGNGQYLDESLDDAEFNGEYYGSPKSWLEIKQENTFITPTSTKTAKVIREHTGALRFHLYTPRLIRKKRLQDRCISEEELLQRLNGGDSRLKNPHAEIRINTSKIPQEDMVMVLFKVLSGIKNKELVNIIGVKFSEKIQQQFAIL